MDYALVQLGASTTSVADVADKQFNFVLSPNPTIGNFNVSLQNLTTASNAILTISDLQGRVVYSDNIENKSQNNLTHSYQLNQLLSKGVYMVSLGDENSTITRKLVIQ
ncbi:MAG: T9SS type A sorting domain-containing protein [Bacteroidetes bacterium]|nr:T9SS type A sorting domain-containing protein [Bacteroidota bacterium]